MISNDVLRDPLREGEDLRWLSFALWPVGRGSEAWRTGEHSVRVLEALAPSRELAWAYVNMCQLAAYDQRGVAVAETYAHRALSLSAFFEDPEAGGQARFHLALTRFIFTGGFEKFPKLKMVCAHVGGALPMLPGRYGFGYELRKDDSFGPWEPDVMNRPPASYMKQLYFDTVCYHPPAVQCAIDTIGIDHVVFGSDSPPVPLPLARAVDTVNQLKIPNADKQKIFSGNAAKLLGLAG